MRLRWHVISAVFSRNFRQYFTSVLGYLFIVAFVVICAMLTFSQQFFADNLANLDQLTKYYPELLLFLVPAITMGLWADEKKQGTDAILFTLPASDLEILLGKYLSVVAVYTVALLFSVTQLIALWWLGTPDLGVTFSTYFGYWVAGVALLAVGMFASSVTKSTTVAFVLGAILCAIPVMLGYLFEGNQFLEVYGVAAQLRDFSQGQISFPGVTYFASIAVFMLYLNLIVITKRHWSRGQQVTLAGHFVARGLGLALSLLSLNVLIENSSALMTNRIDMSSESLFSLDRATRETIAKLKENDRSVTIQAFISDSVPQRYVATKKQLVGLLRQYDRIGGSHIDVRFVDVKANSAQVEEARTLGLESRATRESVGGKIVEQDVFMGALITSTLGEVALPFIDAEASIEYQLTRSLATTTDDVRRLTIGVLETDAHFTNLRVEDREFDWNNVNALKDLRQQYEVIDVTTAQLARLVRPDDPEFAGDSETPAPEAPDVLLVVDPSSLTSTAADDLASFVGQGHPALILADPLPFFYRYASPFPEELGIISAPRQARISPQGQWSVIARTFEPKAYGGKATSLMNALGIQWEYDEIVWHLFEPHAGFKPKLHDLFMERWPDYYGPRENLFVFVRAYGEFQPFNPDSQISNGLRELMFIYPGTVRPAAGAKTKFQPLLTLNPGTAGKLGWDEFTEEDIIEGPTMNPRTGQIETDMPRPNPVTGNPLRRISPRPVRRIDQESHVLAAHITGSGDDKTNVVFIADSDFLTDFYYEQREALGQTLDNFTLLANAIETLAGDSSSARLRNRRPTPRTLTRLEDTTETFRRAAAKKQEAIETEIHDRLMEEEAKLNDAVGRILEDTDATFDVKMQQTDMRQRSAQKDFEKRKEELDQKMALEINKIKTEESNNIASVESRVRFWSIFLAGFPALILGAVVLTLRNLSERRQIDPSRRV